MTRPGKGVRTMAITPDARDGETPDDPHFLAWLGDLATVGVDAVQIRHKDRDDRWLFARVEAACRARDADRAPRVLVNARVDLALAAGADGVHLPAEGVGVAALRREWGNRLLLGVSTHHPDEARSAKEEGADWVTFGPVWDTPSKRRFGAPPGLAGLREAVAVGPDVLGLGGVTSERLDELAAAGAAGVAAIRAFLDPASLVEMARRARRVWPATDP